MLPSINLQYHFEVKGNLLLTSQQQALFHFEVTCHLLLTAYQ